MIESMKHSLLGEQEIEQNLLLPQHINPTKQDGVIDKAKKKWRKNWKCYTLLIIIIVLMLLSIIIPVAILSRKKSTTLSYKCDENGQKLVEEALKGTEAYSRLQTMCFSFGNRLSGSQALEKTIDWVEAQMILDGLQNVHTEPVNVTHWVRGNEYASLQSPYYKKFNILGLGGSINTTSSNGTTGEVIVVTSFNDLNSKSNLVAGKIVLFNVPFTTYDQTVTYRVGGASAAAAYGAIACLVRSITPYSLGTPHTGGMSYDPAQPQIPVAAVTLEDADLMQTLQNLNQTIVVNLYMEAQTMPDMALSRNVMGEITGSEMPESVVVVGGHIDSWDVGVGAMDDGGGVMTAWEAVRLIMKLNIVPLRTIRIVAWTNEENGAAGGENYAQLHANETFFSIETDGGATTPFGLTVAGASANTLKALSEIGEAVLSKPLNSGRVLNGSSGTDNYPLVQRGIPGASLDTNMTQYFWFHHSEGDSFDKMDQTQMDQNVASLAAWIICLANFNGNLPL